MPLSKSQSSTSNARFPSTLTAPYRTRAKLISSLTDCFKKERRIDFVHCNVYSKQSYHSEYKNLGLRLVLLCQTKPARDTRPNWALERLKMWTRFRTPKNAAKKKDSGGSWHTDFSSLSFGTSDYQQLMQEMKSDIVQSQKRIASLEEKLDDLKNQKDAAKIVTKCTTKAFCELLDEAKKNEIDLQAEKLAWKAIAYARASQEKCKSN